MYIIFDYDKEKFNNILNLFKNFLKLNITFNIDNLNEINEDFSEIILDSPLAKDYYDIILKELKKYKYLEKKTIMIYTNHYMNKKNNKLIYKNK